MRAAALIFPLLAIVVSAVAYMMPALFAPYRGFIVPLLTIIMFSMGLIPLFFC